MQRPLSLTLICWMHIGFFAVAVVSILFSADVRQSILQEFEAQTGFVLAILMSDILMGIRLIACAWMLEGKIMGRRIYVVASLALFVDFAINAEKISATLPALLFMLSLFYFLFRPATTQYFLHKTYGHLNDQHNAKL